MIRNRTYSFQSGGGASVSIGADPPQFPQSGDLWWSTDLGELFIWYDDGDSAQWVVTSPGGGAGASPVAVVASIEELRDIPAEGVAITADDGGLWTFLLGDQSARVTADPREGVYVAPAFAPAGTSGAWERQVNGELTLAMFRPDGTGGVEDSAALDGMLAFQNSSLYPAPNLLLPAAIDVGAMIGGPDTQDFLLPLRKIFAAPEHEGRAFKFRRNRQWVQTARPAYTSGGKSYLHLPKNCTLEWEPGALWDFTAWANLTPDNFHVLLSSQIDQTALAAAEVAVQNVNGVVSNGTTTLIVPSPQGSQYLPGERLLLRATAGLDDLGTGAFTLEEPGSIYGAYAEDVYVLKTTATQVFLTNKTKFNYPVAAMPVLRRYTGEPQVALINPTVRGPGRTETRNDGLSFVDVIGGRNFTIDGGKLENFGSRTLRLSSIAGGHIRDLRAIGPEYNGDIEVASGGTSFMAPMGTMNNFSVDNVVTHGFMQSFMETGTGAPGIIDGMTYRDCVSYAPLLGGFSQHNGGMNSTYLRCKVFNSGESGFDIRCRNTKMIDCMVVNATGTAAAVRASINGLLIDGMKVDGAAVGIKLTTFSPYDYVPADIAIRNCRLENIGPSPSGGAIQMDYSLLHDGVRPGLGQLTIAGNIISMRGTTAVSPAIEIGGHWQFPQVVGNHIRGAGVGRTAALPNNPLSTTLNSTNMIVTDPGYRQYGIGSGTEVTLSGVTGSIGPNSAAEMNTTHAIVTPLSEDTYRIGGRTASSVVAGGGTTVSARYRSPAEARSIYLYGGTGGTDGDGPVSPVVAGNLFTSSFSIPLIAHTTGVVTNAGNIQLGVTDKSIGRLTAATTLVDTMAGQEFNNTGALSRVVVTLPAASEETFSRPFSFYVTEPVGFEVRAVGDDKISIGSGAISVGTPGKIASAGGSPARSWLRIWAMQSNQWVAEVDDPANWTVT